MAEQIAALPSGIDICFETFGDPSDPTVLLVMGLATQMIAWDERFCGRLVDHGFHVVRFDNRDVGRSTHLHGERVPTLREIVMRSPSAGVYLLADMADDAAGLLDHLDIDVAHVVGASMGGMIAQTLAATRPERVGSLVSIMSTTGNRWVGHPRLSVLSVLLRAAPRERDAYVEHLLEVQRRIGSPRRDSEPELRALAGRMYDRGRDPAGVARQLGAVVASGDRTAQLRRIAAPTLVLHGDRDRLVAPSGGRATARAIPGAQLDIVRGMAHDLPQWAWDQIIDGIVANARRATQAVRV